MAYARQGGDSVSSSSRPSLGMREDALDRAINDPKYFPALESLANAVIGQDLNSFCSQEELEEYRNELLLLGEEMVKIRQDAAKAKEAAHGVADSYTAASLADIPPSDLLEDKLRKAQQNQRGDMFAGERRPDGRLRELLSNEEEDVAIVGPGGLQTRCPMTQLIMDRPLLNKKCGHYYSPEGFERLKQTKNTRHAGTLRCPICKANFKASDVVEDEEMGARIAQHVRELERIETQRLTQMEAEATLID